MDIWKVLGIAKTKDTDAIVNAYREMLQYNNPEENQEGFMQLRSAYEEALKYAETSDDDVFDPLMSELEQVYGNFRKRNDISIWEGILKDELFQSIDTRVEAENALVGFLMSHFRLSKEVFEFIAREFEWESRFNELIEHFPEGFFLYVFDVINNGEFYKMKYFDGDDYANYDEFIEKCMNLSATIENEPEKAQTLMNEIDELEIYHPFYEELKTEYYYRNNDVEKAYEISQNFLQDCPEEERLLSLRMKILIALDKLDEAEEVYDALIKLNPQNRMAILFTIAKDAKNDVVVAKEKYYQFIRAYDFGEDALDVAKKFNEKLIPYYEERFDQLEDKEKLNLVWAYYEKDDYEKTNELLNRFMPKNNPIIEFRYFKIKGYMSSILGLHEESIENINKWLEYNKHRDEYKDEEKVYFVVDDVQKEKNEKNDLLSMYRALSISYSALGKVNEALEVAEKSMQIDDKNLDSFVYFNRLCLQHGKFDQLIEVNSKAMMENGEVDSLLYFSGIAHFHLGEYGDAMKNFDAAQNMAPYIAKLNFYKMLIFDSWKYYDDYKYVLEEERNQRLLPPEMIELFEIKQQRMEGRFDDAEIRILKLLETIETDEDIIGYDKAVFYSECAYIYAGKGEDEKALTYIRKANDEYNMDSVLELDKGYYLVRSEKFEEAVEHYNYLIANRKPDSIYHVRLASVLARQKENHKAIEQYKKAIALEPDRDLIYTYLSNLYSDIGEEDKALEYKTKAVEIDGNFDNYMDRGITLSRMNKVEEAISDAQKALELDSENADAYTLLGLVYAKDRRYEEAEKAYAKAMQYFDIDNFYFNTYAYAVVLYTRTHQYEKVIEIAKQYFKLSPESENDWIWLNIKMALAYYKTGKINEAQERYNKFLDDKMDPMIHMEYAIFLAETGRESEGLAHLKSLPKSKEHTRNIGFYSYMILGDFKEAPKYYEQAREKKLVDIDDYFDTINEFEAMWYEVRSKKGVINEDLSVNRRLFMAVKLAKIEEFFLDIKLLAEEYYEKYGSYHHEDSQRYFSLLAEAYFYFGEYEQAEKFAKRCLEMYMPDFADNGDAYDAYYVLGMIAEMNGDYQKAFEYYSEIAKHEVNFSIFKQAIERIQKKLK